MNKDVQGANKAAAAPTPDTNSNTKTDKKKQDKIRYQYDEHYFLTDPDEFIQEFWAQDPSWQVRVSDMALFLSLFVSL